MHTTAETLLYISRAKTGVRSQSTDYINIGYLIIPLQLKKLGEVARLIENHYASQRDTEWAFAPGGQKLVLLQARPVTSAHRLDTDFEFYHETDAGVTSEYDCLSKANVGEVFGGSVSPLTLEVSFRCFTKLFKVK